MSILDQAVFAIILFSQGFLAAEGEVTAGICLGISGIIYFLVSYKLVQRDKNELV